eukprot:1983441-Rhodomonas_salina.2
MPVLADDVAAYATNKCSCSCSCSCKYHRVWVGVCTAKLNTRNGVPGAEAQAYQGARRRPCRSPATAHTQAGTSAPTPSPGSPKQNKKKKKTPCPLFSMHKKCAGRFVGGEGRREEGVGGDLGPPGGDGGGAGAEHENRARLRVDSEDPAEPLPEVLSLQRLDLRKRAVRVRVGEVGERRDGVKERETELRKGERKKRN